MADHPLHRLIGEYLNGLMSRSNESISLLRDAACGGNSNIGLYMGEDKQSENELCNPDILLIEHGKVSIVIEIEETRNNPVRILGKFMASTLADSCVTDSDSYEFQEDTLFIQVAMINSGGMKQTQLKKIEALVNKELLSWKIKQYKMLMVRNEQLQQDIEQIINCVRARLRE